MRVFPFQLAKRGMGVGISGISFITTVKLSLHAAVFCMDFVSSSLLMFQVEVHDFSVTTRLSEINLTDFDGGRG